MALRRASQEAIAFVTEYYVTEVLFAALGLWTGIQAIRQHRKGQQGPARKLVAWSVLWLSAAALWGLLRG